VVDAPPGSAPAMVTATGPSRGLRGPDRRGKRAAERLTWRFIVDDACTGARNMALDHALARRARPAEAVLRLYAWRTPTVSFGRNEPAAGRYSGSVARALGMDCVRRPTGGRAVLHDREVTYAVVAREGALGGPREAYRRINEAIAVGLRTLGAPVTVVERGTALAPDAGPCFRAPAAGEIVARGRKLVGSAQARLEGALLQHGSIVLAGDQSRLEALRSDRASTEALYGGDGPATLAGLVGTDPCSPDDLARRVTDALRGSFEDAFGGSWKEEGFTPGELAEADELEARLYGSAEWTWRR
jgi:lipoate-protein ligase A